MKATDLIALLQKYAERNPEVIVTWEGTMHELTPAHVYMGTDGNLLIDADGCGYKPALAADPTENER